ncbi:MAG: ATP-binding protein [Aeromicrobium sp.]
MTTLLARRGVPTERRVTALVVAGLVVFVALVYGVVVLGGGALIGRTSSPDLGLSIVATVIVALGLGPVQSRLQHLAGRLLGSEQDPYAVLSRFTAALTRSHDEEVPQTMARLLAEGTCAEWAQVWLLVDDHAVLAATWPDGSRPSDDDAVRGRETPRLQTRPVVLGGEQLGVLRLQQRPDQSLTPVEERLLDGLAAQAGVVLHGARLRTQLALRAEQLSGRADALRSSRQRIVEVQDAERRRIERDIHDGAQQHLVALAVNLRLAHTLAGSSPSAAVTVLAGQVAAVDAAIATLVELSRGIYPAELDSHGIGAALRSAIAATSPSVTVVDETTVRPAPATELAVYFCCLEAVQNALKHAAPSRVEVRLTSTDEEFTAVVGDDGQGFDTGTASGGSGVSNMRDRLDAVGGSVTTQSAPGRGTSVTVRAPLDPGDRR